MGAQPENEQAGNLAARQTVLDQLEKVLSSPPFEGAERSRRLLRFVVEQTVGGQADRLKEYTLATQVLGRSSAFDPRGDPIVRAEVSRLRDRLSRYYAKEGLIDPFVIELPKGSYVPRFERRTVPPVTLNGVDQPPPRRKRLLWMALAVAAAASILMALVGLTRTMPSSGEISVAVLPLANLSSDPGREFFADGVTDEIAVALARVANLKVVARSSAYAFKNRAEPSRKVGQALGATHFIEGSVRENDGRVRIAVQLTKAETGLQLWSAVYDRELTDIFVVQEDIARRVAASLNVTLGLKPGENLVNNRSIDPASYEKYLRGKTLFEARGGVPAGTQDQNLTQAAAVLEDAVAKNPAYAPAWAALGGTYYGLAQNNSNATDVVYARAAADGFRIKGEAAGKRSVELDSNLSEAYDVLAVFTWSRARTVEAANLYEKALALDPADPNALGGYAIRLATVGRLKEALDLAERALRADPFYPTVAAETAQDRWLNGQSESAIALAKTLRPSDRARLLTLMYASMHRFGDAADSLMELAAGDAQSDVAKAARLLRMAPAKITPAELPRLPPALSMLYLYLGAPERALQLYDRMVEVGFMYGNRSAVWHPDYALVRKTERFKALMRETGLVDYWKARGWPDLCHPTTGENFVCD
jgi:adenylate cyclase